MGYQFRIVEHRLAEPRYVPAASTTPEALKLEIHEHVRNQLVPGEGFLQVMDAEAAQVLWTEMLAPSWPPSPAASGPA